jgi:hypothetical protein
MTKKYYVQPTLTIEKIAPAKLVCNSQAVTSDVGIDYGGVDEEGTVTVESRRHRTAWDEEATEETR